MSFVVRAAETSDGPALQHIDRRPHRQLGIAGLPTTIHLSPEPCLVVPVPDGPGVVIDGHSDSDPLRARRRDRRQRTHRADQRSARPSRLRGLVVPLSKGSQASSHRDRRTAQTPSGPAAVPGTPTRAGEGFRWRSRVGSATKLQPPTTAARRVRVRRHVSPRSIRASTPMRRTGRGVADAPQRVGACVGSVDDGIGSWPVHPSISGAHGWSETGPPTCGGASAGRFQGRGGGGPAGARWGFGCGVVVRVVVRLPFDGGRADGCGGRCDVRLGAGR